MEKKHAEAVVVTVGTTEQKRLCEKLVSDVKGKTASEIIVVCDEDFGGRIGSGGALIGVIEKFYEIGRKLLVINSGGMSKRSVNYSVRGKLFANLMLCGETVTLLEMLIKNGERLFSLFESGIAVFCSDIPVDTENLKDIFTENTALAIRTDFDTASRHGVMYRDGKNFLDRYPHKIPAEKLREMSREYGEEKPLADTGAVYFCDSFCRSLKELAKKEKVIERISKDKVDLNLYPDIVALLANKIDEEYFSSFSNETHRQIKRLLFDLLSHFSLEVRELCTQKFVHMGTLRESRENIFEISGEKDTFLKLNSYVDESSQVGNGTVLDNVILKNCFVGERSIVSDVTLEDGVSIGKEKAVCGIRLKDGSFVSVVCDIDENPKEDGLWNALRFYRGKSYTQSYNKFTSQSDEEKISMAYCVENADVDFYFDRCRYIKDMSSYRKNDDYLRLRETIIKNFFSKQKKIKTFACEKEKASLLLPVRVNLSGTWTDAMPYCVYNGGEVVNMAVTVDGEKPIEVIAEKIDEKRIEFCSDGVREIFAFGEDKKGEDFSDFNLHRAVLETAGIDKETSLQNGLRLTTSVASIDKGSGLGTSSILLGGCFRVLGELLGKEYTEDEIFEMVFVAEQIMKTGGGWQDQAGGLTPGMKAVSSEAGTEQKLHVKEIALSPSFRKFISEKFILIPTGQRHFGRFIVNDVAERYLEKNHDSLQGYCEMKELNGKLLKSIEKEDFSAFSECINEHFRILRKISPAVSDGKIDRLSQALLEKHVSALSVCGAGGGGYLLAVMNDDVSVDDISQFIKNNFPYVKGRIKKIDIFY